jgi:hypothetical protein
MHRHEDQRCRRARPGRFGDVADPARGFLVEVVDQDLLAVVETALAQRQARALQRVRQAAARHPSR